MIGAERPLWRFDMQYFYMNMWVVSVIAWVAMFEAAPIMNVHAMRGGNYQMEA